MKPFGPAVALAIVVATASRRAQGPAPATIPRLSAVGVISTCAAEPAECA